MEVQSYLLYAVYRTQDEGWVYGVVVGWSGQHESPGSMTPWVADTATGHAVRVVGQWWLAPTEYSAGTRVAELRRG